ncbi:MAG: 5-(carboxyamino)imidazole ribonucleotide synthase [Bacteroidia bacterium]|nr:5-(carboxyamino)imidazole ribonucleotide synthase [Bacteroidia bacterium]
MEQLVTSDFKLGIIAGGQLGKMLVLAASNWDVRTYILDTDDHCPAATSCTCFVQGSQLDYDDVIRFGNMVDLITFEIENVNIEALKQLKADGKKIYPEPETLEIIQDKGLQKIFYRDNHIPSPRFVLCDNREAVLAAAERQTLPLPFVQKLRKGGYDGKGVALMRSKDDLVDALNGASVVESLIDIRKEIAVIVARNGRGETQCFPVVEMEFNDEANLVERLICPAALDAEILAQATDIATRIVSLLNLRGVLAVEMFVDTNNAVWVNEIAPRPHNSGHHTIESVVTSQFEQLLRAIFNFPLGSTQLKMPSVMINLLGEPGCDGPVRYEGLTECMSIGGVKIHLYGKKVTKPFRKMGHVTVLAPTIEEAIQKSDIVKRTLRVTSW